LRARRKEDATQQHKQPTTHCLLACVVNRKLMLLFVVINSTNTSKLPSTNSDTSTEHTQYHTIQQKLQTQLVVELAICRAARRQLF